MKSLGVDLAGKDKNPTGICLLDGSKTTTCVAHSDEEILTIARETRPDVIAVDAPFSFPEEGYFRDSDEALQKEGFKPLSPMFKGMQPLVNRASGLVKTLRSEGFDVIEVFPKASECIMGLKPDDQANEHVYDALLCALTGKCFLEGRFRELGKEKIVVPG